MRADFSTLYWDYPVSNNLLAPICEICMDPKADSSQAEEIRADLRENTLRNTLKREKTFSVLFTFMPPGAAG
jgi:hypothetical protein